MYSQYLSVHWLMCIYVKFGALQVGKVLSNGETNRPGKNYWKVLSERLVWYMLNHFIDHWWKWLLIGRSCAETKLSKILMSKLLRKKIHSTYSENVSRRLVQVKEAAYPKHVLLGKQCRLISKRWGNFLRMRVDRYNLKVKEVIFRVTYQNIYFISRLKRLKYPCTNVFDISVLTAYL